MWRCEVPSGRHVATVGIAIGLAEGESKRGKERISGELAVIGSASRIPEDSCSTLRSQSTRVVCMGERGSAASGSRKPGWVHGLAGGCSLYGYRVPFGEGWYLDVDECTTVTNKFVFLCFFRHSALDPTASLLYVALSLFTSLQLYNQPAYNCIPSFCAMASTLCKSL